jgi:hypothetical protein
MSFFYESFSTHIADVLKPHSFVGKDTGTPTKAGTDEIFLSDNDADCHLSDHVEKHQSLWVRYYDGDENKLTSATLTKLIAKRKTISLEVGKIQLAGLRQALKGKTRTCKSCKRTQHMVDYTQLTERIERNLQLGGHYFPYFIGCYHCKSKSLPFTAAIRKREELWLQKREANELAVLSERTKLCVKATKKGVFTVKARVGALLHESLLRQYEDEHEEDEYEDF